MCVSLWVLFLVKDETFSPLSQEVLAVYLQQYPDSAVALNLKACNHFRLYNGKAAEVGHRYDSGTSYAYV